jgi:hypothetical protein
MDAAVPGCGVEQVRCLGGTHAVSFKAVSKTFSVFAVGLLSQRMCRVEFTEAGCMARQAVATEANLRTFPRYRTLAVRTALVGVYLGRGLLK